MMHKSMPSVPALVWIPISPATLDLTQPARAETLVGTSGKGAGAGWVAAWIDLSQPAAFSNGEAVRLRVSGARWVRVRCLPVGASPPPPKELGIEGGVREVPENGGLHITLGSDHPRVEQIAVHAGASAASFQMVLAIAGVAISIGVFSQFIFMQRENT